MYSNIEETVKNSQRRLSKWKEHLKEKEVPDDH